METKKRLIDANKISYHKSGFPKGDGFDSRLDWAFREDIDKLPTVDAVEIPPVKIGDTAFFIINGKLYEAKICLIQWCHSRYGETNEIRGSVYEYHSVSASFSEWGKTVFATREEAERILYPCEHCISGTYRNCEGCSYAGGKNDEVHSSDPCHL